MAVKENSYYIERLRKYFKGLLGYEITFDGDDESGIAVMISDDPDMNVDWQNGEITSFYFYFYPQYKRATSEKDLKMYIYLSSMGVKKADRGKGIAGKFIAGIMYAFGNDIGEIAMNDLNQSGIWQYIASKYPKIKWTID